MFTSTSMNIAILEAKKAVSEVPIGAVIINSKNNKVIAKAHNLVEQTKNPISHAEILVINQACNTLQSKTLAGYDLYVTLQPCPMCMHAIILAKIRRLYFGAYDSDIPLNLYPNNHKLEIYGGILEEECKQLLTNFFSLARKINS